MPVNRFPLYGIAPPISPWDEKHTALIEMDTIKRSIGETAAEAWRRFLFRQNEPTLDKHEFSRRVQHWHDRGYRVKEVTLEFYT